MMKTIDYNDHLDGLARTAMRLSFPQLDVDVVLEKLRQWSDLYCPVLEQVHPISDDEWVTLLLPILAEYAESGCNNKS